jgi:hypothetical protein
MNTNQRKQINIKDAKAQAHYDSNELTNNGTSQVQMDIYQNNKNI